MHRTFAAQIRFHRTYCKFVLYADLASSRGDTRPVDGYRRIVRGKNRARPFSRFPLFRRSRRHSREVNCILNF